MLRLQTLGALNLIDAEGTPRRSLLAQTKRMALLAYLCVERPADYKRRDTLVALFWPESPEDAARHALRQALYKLRQSLGSELLEVRGVGAVRLSPGIIRTDAIEFEELLDAGRRAEALGVYRGDFLPGLHVGGAAGFERWHDRKRSELRSAAAQASWLLAGEQIARGAAREAELTALQAMRLDPANEFIAEIDAASTSADSLRTRRTLHDVLRAELAARGGGPPSKGSGGRLQRSASLSQASAPGTHTSDPLGGDAPPGVDTVGAGSSIGASEPGPTASTVGREAHRSRSGLLQRPTWSFLVAALALVALVVAVSLPRTQGATTGGVPGVAVLPVVSGHPNPDDPAAGIHAELVDQLRRISGLRVVSWASTLRFDPTVTPIREIAGDLRVDYVVTTSARIDGDQVRLLVELVDGRTEVVLWGDAYDRALSVEGVVEMQIEMARGVARALSLETREEEFEPPAHTQDVAAYLLFLKGRDYARQALNETPRSERRRSRWRLAFDLFRQAIEVDPGFVAAYANLAVELLTWMQVDHPGGAGPTAELDSLRMLARNAADRAMELDPSFPLSQAAAASVSYYLDREYERAVEQADRALSLAPSNPLGLRIRGGALRRLGRLSETASNVEKMARVDPLSEQWLGELGNIYLAMRDLRRARQAYEQLEVLSPHGNWAWTGLVLTHLRSGDVDAAVHVSRRCTSAWDAPNRCGNYEAALFDRDYARAAISTDHPMGQAVAYRLMGDHDRANSRLAAAIVRFEAEIEARAGYCPGLDCDLLVQSVEGLALALAWLGREDEARPGAQRARQLRNAEPRDLWVLNDFSPTLLGVWITLGERREAFHELEGLLTTEYHQAWTPALAAADPRLDPLRGDPRFQRLTAQRTDLGAGRE